MKPKDPAENADSQSDTRVKPIRFTSLNELFKEKTRKIEWVVDSVLQVGGTSFAAGKPKVGKSTLGRNLAFAVATGRPFLGFKTRQTPVVYAGFEENREQVKDHFKRMGASGSEPIFIPTTDGFTPPGQETFDLLRAAIVEYKAGLAIVEPLQRLVPVKDISDYAVVSAALSTVAQLASETRCHIMLAHHNSKTDREAGDQLLGSTALLGTVETLLSLRKKEKYRTLESVQRYGTAFEPFALAFDVKTGRLSLMGTVWEAEIREMIGTLTKFFTETKEWMTEAEIKEKLTGRARSAALRCGVDERLFRRIGKGGRGDPYKYQLFDLPDPDAEAGTGKEEI